MIELVQFQILASPHFFAELKYDYTEPVRQNNENVSQDPVFVPKFQVIHQDIASTKGIHDWDQR